MVGGEDDDAREPLNVVEQNARINISTPVFRCPVGTQNSNITYNETMKRWHFGRKSQLFILCQLDYYR